MGLRATFFWCFRNPITGFVAHKVHYLVVFSTHVSFMMSRDVNHREEPPQDGVVSGAADGNRTRVSGLGSVRSTTELQPHKTLQKNLLYVFIVDDLCYLL